MRKTLSLLLMLVLFSALAFAQNHTITGIVKNEEGKPVQDVSVVVLNTKNGTVTKSDGSYSLSIGSDAKQLAFSFSGYSTQIVSLSAARNDYSVILTATLRSMDEVVITGINKVKRTEYPGAVSRLDRAQVENKPTGSFDQIFQGQVPGVLSVTGSGQPGTSASIIIRGSSSIAGNSNPLYIIDGIPVEGGAFQGLNANDIQSIDVLKDGSSTALYGSRGATGVIVVTTRRGSGQKMKLGYSVQYGVKSKPDFAFKPMGTAQLLKTQEDYGKIAGGGSAIPGWFYSKSNPRYATLGAAGQAAADAALDSISKINTNWNDYIFRDGNFSNHQLTLSGGTGKTRSYTSLELYNEEGTTYRTDMKRVSLRNNIDYSDDKLSYALSSSLAYTKRNFQQSTTTNSTQNPFLVLNIAPPTALAYNPDGSYATGSGSKYVAADQLDYTKYDQNYNNQLKAVIGMTASYKITEDLTASVTTGIDYRETQGTNYGSKLAFLRTISTSATTKAGFLTESLSRYLSADVRPSLDYIKTIGEKSKISVSVVGEYIREFRKTVNSTGYGIDPRTPATPAAITQGDGNNLFFANVGGSKTQNALVSGLILGSYTYNDKYTISGSYRDDGSSKLPLKNRWQKFYSAGAVWNISKENFLKESKVVNNLRLRASYGGAGDNTFDNFVPFGDFGYLPAYAANGNYSGLTTLYVTSVGNPNLKWEQVYTTNLGVDFSLLKNRVYGSIELYDKRTNHASLFVQKQLTAEGGGYTIQVNGGELQNKGIEWDLSFDVVKTRSFIWTLTANGAYNKNKVLSLGGLGSFTSGTSLVTVGLPLGSNNTVKWAGVDAATGVPLYYNKAGIVTPTYSADNAVQQFGTSEAPWKGGFGTQMTYKSFGLSLLFSWQKNAFKTDNLEYFVENPVGFLSGGYNQSADLNFWKNPGDIASTPSPLYGTNFTSKLIHDASFLRFKDITVSYALPKELLGKSKIVSRARFYVQGTNLFIWTKWRGMDPEAGAFNINLSEYPNPRAVTAGLDITF